METQGIAAADDEALQTARFHAADLEQVFHGGATLALDGDGVGEAPAVVAAELHTSPVGKIVKVAGLEDHVPSLGDVFLPLLNADGEFFGQEGVGGVVGDLLESQETGRERVLLGGGVRERLFPERSQVRCVVSRADGEPGGVTVPEGVKRLRMAVRAPQDLEEFGSPWEGVFVGQVTGEQLEHRLQGDGRVEVGFLGSPWGVEAVMEEFASGPGFVGGPQERAADGAVLRSGFPRWGWSRSAGVPYSWSSGKTLRSWSRPVKTVDSGMEGALIREVVLCQEQGSSAG